MSATQESAGAGPTGAASILVRLRRSLPWLILTLAALALPFSGNDYWAVIAARAAIYWVLVAGLNLVVGFAGQLAIGYVALLTLGAYTASILVARLDLNPFLALAAAGAVGAVAGIIIGLPALRLRTFYFAMTTLGFATIVTQVALAWQSVTGGGVGVAGPVMPAPLDTPWGLCLFCLGCAALSTWVTVIASSRFGRALVALRDAEVAAEVCGISKPTLLLSIFLISGCSAAVAGGLFATLQSYITPDAFTFDLSVLFFIAILIGGRGSILGPRDLRILCAAGWYEPSAGLSPVLVDRVLAVAARLREQGTAVLLVEQLIEKALRLADRVVALSRGRVVMAAATSEQDLPRRLEQAYFGTQVPAGVYA